MKRFFALLICSILIFSSISVFAADISTVANPVVAGGEEIKFDQPPVLYDSELMLPLRFIVEKLGATVSWQGELKTVFCNIGDKVCTLQIGTKKLFVGTQAIDLEVAPVILEGRTLVPTIVIEQITGLSCEWEDGKLFIR